MADLLDAMRCGAKHGDRPQTSDVPQGRRPSSTSYIVPSKVIVPSLTEHTTSIYSPSTQSRKLGYTGPEAEVKVESEAESINISSSSLKERKTELSNSILGAESVQLQKGLGGNMENVLGVHIPHTIASNRRGPLNYTAIWGAVRREAEKTGEIIAFEDNTPNAGTVEETIGIDLSTLDGQQYLPNRAISEEKQRKSYFFPPDPEKPAWKPFSMRWPYLSFLVVLAFVLAGVQEYLCQTSIRKAKSGGALLKFHSLGDITSADYFTWKYLPTMVLVVYGLLWNVVNYEVKRLEAFYQMSRREGAVSSRSLSVNYQTFASYFIPVVAIRNKEWAVVCSSVATLIASALAPIIQSASVSVYPKNFKDPKVEKSVKIVAAWSRCLTAALFIPALSGVWLMLLLRRKSGLLSDPKGIAAIAAMSTKSLILADFQELDVASNDNIHARLRYRSYNLHKSSLWQGEYIRPRKTLSPPDATENPHPIMLHLESGIAYITYLIVFLAIILIYVFIPAVKNAVEKAPFIVTALATIIKLLWGALDMSIRVIEPYYLLSKRHAPPKTLTLDYTGTAPGYLFIKAAIDGHFLVAAVGLGGLLAEALIVCVTSFGVGSSKSVAKKGFDGAGDVDSYNQTEAFKPFWISLGLSLLILSYLVGVASAVYARRRHQFLPRQPGSIANVLAYIHQSPMLEDLIDTETLNSRQVTRHLERIGKTYALGWFTGRDNEDHCGIDQEVILSNYVHNYDWTRSKILGTGTR